MTNPTDATRRPHPHRPMIQIPCLATPYRVLLLWQEDRDRLGRHYEGAVNLQIGGDGHRPAAVLVRLEELVSAAGLLASEAGLSDASLVSPDAVRLAVAARDMAATSTLTEGDSAALLRAAQRAIGLMADVESDAAADLAALRERIERLRVDITSHSAVRETYVCVDTGWLLPRVRALLTTAEAGQGEGRAEPTWHTVRDAAMGVLAEAKPGENRWLVAGLIADRATRPAPPSDDLRERVAHAMHDWIGGVMNDTETWESVPHEDRGTWFEGADAVLAVLAGQEADRG